MGTDSCQSYSLIVEHEKKHRHRFDPFPFPIPASPLLAKFTVTFIYKIVEILLIFFRKRTIIHSGLYFIIKEVIKNELLENYPS